MAATCVKDIDSPGLLLSPLVTSSVKQASTDRVDKEEEETNDSTHSLHYRLGIFIIYTYNININLAKF
jgi:hypothetical protein